jgi:hypothetical protein
MESILGCAKCPLGMGSNWYDFSHETSISRIDKLVNFSLTSRSNEEAIRLPAFPGTVPALSSVQHERPGGVQDMNRIRESA